MKPVKKKLLKYYYKKTPVNYDSYLRWLDDDENSGHDFSIISTFNYEINEREKWNSVGMEIYNISKLTNHASKINLILKSIHAENFIIQHEYSPKKWVPADILSNLDTGRNVLERMASIKSFMKDVDLSVFDGGFEVTGNISEFIMLFIDYPFLLNYKNIDCISLEMDLILKINHHLEVQFISSSKELLTSIRNECYQKSLDFRIIYNF